MFHEGSVGSPLDFARERGVGRGEGAEPFDGGRVNGCSRRREGSR